MKKVCAVSGVEFEVTDADLTFYEKMGVPAPTLCPDERARRRFAWRNERTLYWRKCDGTGKRILSVFHPDSPLTVYDPEHWYSDAWNPMQYGREFDFSRPFFEQFFELVHDVPQVARSVVQNQNCDFVNQCGLCKNCYLIFEAVEDEACLYGNYVYHCRSCVDCVRVDHCELCYECVDCENCYESRYLQNCKTCHDSWFLKNCVGCNNCFGCVNLRNKQHYFLNQKCTPEEYAQKVADWHLEKFSKIRDLRRHFAQFCEQFPQKFQQGTHNEDSTGDYLDHTQRCRECFATSHSQDCAWIFNCTHVRDCHDLTVFGTGAGCTACHECHEIGQGCENVIFSDQVWMSCYNVAYSKLCQQNCHDLFGCVGLRHADHCIFNKKYSPDEYEKLRAKIIEHMKSMGEWGEFFPIKNSPFAYNETLAQDYFPLNVTDPGVQKSGDDYSTPGLNFTFRWRDPDLKEYRPQDFHVPDTIAEVDDSICQQVLACEKCGKNFQIQRTELKFLREAHLPLPYDCPDCRHAARMALRNPRKLYLRNCAECGVNFETTVAPERPEKVVCDACHQKSVN